MSIRSICIHLFVSPHLSSSQPASPCLSLCLSYLSCTPGKNGRVPACRPTDHCTTDRAASPSFSLCLLVHALNCTHSCNHSFLPSWIHYFAPALAHSVTHSVTHSAHSLPSFSFMLWRGRQGARRAPAGHFPCRCPVHLFSFAIIPLQSSAGASLASVPVRCFSHSSSTQPRELSLSLSTGLGVGSSVLATSPVRTRTPAVLGGLFVSPRRILHRGAAVLPREGKFLPHTRLATTLCR